MRILHTGVVFDPSDFNGVKNKMIQQSAELVRRGHEVTVYTSNAKTETRNHRLKARTIKGIKVRYFNRILPKLMSSWFLTPSMIRYVSKHIKSFDIVQLYSHRNFQNTVAYCYCRKYGIPYVLSPGGSLPHHGSRTLFKKVYDAVVGNRIIRDAEYLIGLTELEGEQCREWSGKKGKVVVIPNAVDPRSIPGKDPNFLGERYGIKSRRVVLFVGRISNVKGLPFLVRAVARSKGTHLIIAGRDHGYLNAVKREIAKQGIGDRVTFTGYVSGNDKWQLYLNATCFALPSRTEAFGNVVPEALACGCPVIVADTCAVSKAIREERIGTVVRYNDIEGLKEAIEIEASPDTVGRGKRYVEANWTWRSVGDILEKVYSEAIDGFS